MQKRIVGLERANEELVARVSELEEGLLQERRLQLRVAELTDLVTTLIGAAVRGEDEFRRVLEASAPASPEL